MSGNKQAALHGGMTVYVCVCVCVCVCVIAVTICNRLSTNLVWLPILLVVSSSGKLTYVHIRAWEFGLATTVRPSCATLARAFSTPRLNLVLIAYSRVLLLSDPVSIYSTATIGSVPIIVYKVHAVAYRWHSPPRVRRHGASSPQGSCIFRYV